VPVACLLTHDPDPRTALFLDDRGFASCRRCGAGLIDQGDGWHSPLGWIDVLLRKPVPGYAPAFAPVRMRSAA
jgi:hypothetical protein